MARKILITGSTGSPVRLVERPADSEYELQQVMLENPQLVPADDLGLDDDLLVVGRETTLASGSVDLLCLSKSGEIVIIEFKTGPQNPDFRHALAQVIDYGSDLWKLAGWEEFDEGVVHRHLRGRYADPGLQAAKDLRGAASAAWQISSEEWAALILRLDQVLSTGDFHFVVAAQRFTDPMKDSVRYLNATSRFGRYFLIEVIRLDGGGQKAFAAQVVEQPSTSASARGGTASKANRDDFLGAIADPEYREAMSELFATVNSLGLVLKWYSKGASIRLKSPDRRDPLSVGWVFLEDGQWYGARHVTFGVDPASLEGHPSLRAAVEKFCALVEGVAGGKPTSSGLRATTFEPQAFPGARSEILRLLAQLSDEAGV